MSESYIKNYIQSHLNEQQFNASIYTDSSSLILAWAWSGKTRALTYKIAYLIFWKRINTYNILAVTFTNKAANEMKERLLKISDKLSTLWNMDQLDYKESWVNSLWVSNDPVINNDSNKTHANINSESIIDFDDLIANESTSQSTITQDDMNWYLESIQKLDDHNLSVNLSLNANSLKRVWTFHSIFLKILKEDIEKMDLWYTKNFWIYDESESLSLVKSIIADMKLTEKLDYKECKRKISSLKNAWITYQKFLHTLESEIEEQIAKVYEKYQKSLQTANSVDFDDLLLLPEQLFKLKPDVLEKRRNRFKYILVDEAQDTNGIQFEIIRLLSWKSWNVTFIWDDYQSIYWWRWAVMDNFLNIDKYWNNVKIFKLETNYRSLPHIVEAWNIIIKKNTKQYDKTVVSHRKWTDQIRIFSYQDEVWEAINTINLISKLKDEKKIRRSDFGILYRTNAQSQPFEQILLTEGIPYKVWWGFKFFERKEIKDIISYVKYIINPRDSVSLKRIINTPNRKIWDASIWKIEEYAMINWNTINEIVENIERIPIKLTTNVINAIKQFNTIIRFIISQFNNLNPTQIINHIVSSIKYKDYLISLDGKEKAEERFWNIWQLINMTTKYQWTGIDSLRQFMEEVSLMTDLELSQEWNNDAVKLMSVHASKWLEFPIVFIVGLEDGIFPLPKAKFEQKEMEEERRLMYVAITRAQNVLFLSYANSRQQWWQIKYNAPSQFLSELPNELVKQYDIWWWAKRWWSSNFEEWDTINHKIFWTWKILEIWWDVVVVRFNNPKYNIRKLDIRFISK